LFAAAAVVGALALGPVPARAEMQLHLQNPAITTMLSNDMDKFDRMVRTETPVNLTDGEGQPLILLAARNGLDKAVEILIKQGARVDYADPHGNTALMWAADQGHDAIVERLLAAGANPNLQNRQGLTPLIRAARNGQRAVVEDLLKRGADVTITDYTGRGPLSWARDGRSPGVERALENAGAVD
jgi:ankyrin repeat protein